MKIETRQRKLASLPPESECGPRELKARRMWACGYTYAQIGEELGVGRTRATEMVTDPGRARAMDRKSRYSKPCVECGAPLRPAGPNECPTGRCGDCTRRFQHETRRWTPEAVVSALQEWAGELGRSPLAAEAFQPDAKVCCGVVQRELGSWTKGLVAAGLEAPRRGNGTRGRHLTTDERAEIARLYVDGNSLTTVAKKMDVSGMTVRATLRRLGVPTRSRSAAQRLRRANEREVAA